MSITKKVKSYFKNVKQDINTFTEIDKDIPLNEASCYACPHCGKRTYFTPVIGGFKCKKCGCFIKQEDLKI